MTIRHKNKKILLVEDTPSLSRIYEEYLGQAKHRVVLCETGGAALQAIKDQPDFDLILLDLKLPDIDGMDVLRNIEPEASHIPVIMMTAHGSVNNAVETMRLGAIDFLVKPFNADRLLITMDTVLENSCLKKIVKKLENSNRNSFQGFVGSSPVMQAVYNIIENAASSKATIFIKGESGTGKEVCAEAIHKQSPRANKAFVPLNCGAIPKDLMESEIFGHIKGSFTGAIQDRKGAAQMADGGTLFLDEICEMDINLQTKLLRFIQTGQFQSVGSNQLEKVDIRIICATNKDPMEEVQAGRFREDLYYRLHVIPIDLPPLRERGEDILELAYHFLDQTCVEEDKSFKKFAPSLESFLLEYDWPGNIRELQNMIRTIVVLNTGDEITADHLTGNLAAQYAHYMSAYSHNNNSKEAQLTHNNNNKEGYVMQGRKVNKYNNDQVRPLWIIEKEAIEQAIDICEGNIPKAAAMLEISPSTIYRKKASWEEHEKGYAASEQ